MSPRASGHAHAPFFFVTPPLVAGAEFVFDRTDSHHLAVVRRARPGDTVIVSDGRGAVADAELVDVERDRVTAKVGQVDSRPAPSPRVTVFQGLSKGTKVDLVVQKCVELGVDEIVVFDAARTVPDLDARKQAHVVQRWKAVALEAAKQSHRAWLPEVRGPVAWADALAEVAEYDSVIVGHGDAATSFSEVAPLGEGRRSVGVVVGPEGGFSASEVAQLPDAGAGVVTLGEQVLRTETAAIVLASLVMYRTGRLGGRST